MENKLKMAVGDFGVPSWEVVTETIKARFAVDPRALAALRVGLGALLLGDLVLRTRHIGAFYTDTGVLPRGLLCESYPLLCPLSLHALSGELWLPVVLLIVTGVAAAALAVGYRTRLAAAASLVLLVSAHIRNPLILNGGDAMLRRLLFWGALLPLGAKWGLNASRGGEESEPVVSLASAGLLLQVVVVYTVNGVLKVQNPAWVDGTAVRRVFHLDQFLVLLGPRLSNHPELLLPLSKVWLLLLLASGLLVALPGWGRTAVVGLFAGVHVIMLATMRLGLFPLISLVALLPFLPSGVWDRVEGALPDGSTTSRRPGRQAARAMPGLLVGVPNLSVALDTRQVSSAVAGLALVAMLSWNTAALEEGGGPDGPAGNLDPNDDRWDMFVRPYRSDVWYTAPGVLGNGAPVHAFHGEEVSTGAPPPAGEMYPTARWRKYLVTVWTTGGREDVVGFADYLCHRWDSRHAMDLASVRIRRHEQRTDLDGSPSVSHETLVGRACP